ncbi:uncharacterized protein DUF1266 [Chromohalobacter marismortui]|uniref:Uncharacterized protein DUF1266 n=1 Tax=Chromohalobacter marismortui TaxID=42055 RepID=A0A4R7NVL1_9GAMM|nr:MULTISPECIES: YbeU/YbeR family protein [Chromohalobacter]MCI0510621.1 DUF1266 domain-containing protein [Chromohalobacter sp.]MCI0591936.1 DUF1266 domain-containing protein [Chromohalobacter sp.]TDU24802.1 uncharacterized protein DUF1266 [Chromohalobacter marismortui]
MIDPLNAWWAQQLVLCGWAFDPEPLSVSPETAQARLALLDVRERGELGWRLAEACMPGQGEALRQLQALELLALSGAAGWLDASSAQAWAEWVAADIQRHHASLDAWLTALRHARGQIDWTQDDEGFLEACQALSQLEREAAGITWEVLATWLSDRPRRLPWPATQNTNAWRLRAVFAPVLSASCDAHLDWPGVKSWLTEIWRVEGRDELIRMLLWLGGQGHRYTWDLDATRLMGQDERARHQWWESLGEATDYGQVMLAFLDSGEPLEWAAWDWLRLVDLAYAGWNAGWLEAHEAEAFAAHAGDLLMRRYRDWTAVAKAYQRGRSLFEGADRRADFARDWDVLLRSRSSPWQVTLDVLLDDAQREASRQAIRDWRAPAWHWVLALSAVREPDLLYRQGIDRAPETQQRADARRYLRDTLGLDPATGTASLASLWLPAQAHHLNQLAADAAHGALPEVKTPFGRALPDAVQVRNGLKHCTRHAATIFMAEKYAFYLMMCADSGDYDRDELESLAEALRGVLSRFYTGPGALLEAWAAWEAALPEGDEPSLVADIRWHRDDPGSPLHWLDWHHGSWREPGERLSLPRFTALALVGPLNAPVWGAPRPEAAHERDELREWLDSHYGLLSAEALAEFVDFLLEAGDRQEYQINYAPYTLNAARLREEIAIIESGECSEDERNHLLRLRRVANNISGCNDYDMAAWDVAQAVDLAIAGRQMEWLSAQAFDHLVERAAHLAQTHYASWYDYARGLFAGFSFFMGETDEREAFLQGFSEALTAWLTAAPPMAGSWASLDFPGAPPRHWAPLHIDTLPGDVRTLH